MAAMQSFGLCSWCLLWILSTKWGNANAMRIWKNRLLGQAEAVWRFLPFQVKFHPHPVHLFGRGLGRPGTNDNTPVLACYLSRCAVGRVPGHRSGRTTNGVRSQFPAVWLVPGNFPKPGIWDMNWDHVLDFGKFPKPT